MDIDELIRKEIEIIKRNFLSWKIPLIELPPDSIIENTIKEILKLNTDISTIEDYAKTNPNESKKLKLGMYAIKEAAELEMNERNKDKLIFSDIVTEEYRYEITVERFKRG